MRICTVCGEKFKTHLELAYHQVRNHSSAKKETPEARKLRVSAELGRFREKMLRNSASH